MPTPVPIFTDGDFTAATAISKPFLSQPFPGDAGLYLLTQDFMQFTDSFAALALNTAHPIFTTYFLTGESRPADLGGGIIRWTRTYCQVPASRNDGGSTAYRFIGYANQTNVVSGTVTVNLLGRPRFTRVVDCRIQHDYYMVGAGGAYADETGIPLLQEQLYYVPLGNSTLTSGVLTYAPLYPQANPLQALTGNAVDYLNDNQTYSGIAFSAPPATVPSRTAYLAMVAAGTYIVAEASKPTRWQGNIWDRVTTYVRAQ
ncbi:MAG: hypothetical protein JWQ04_2792 [Pedosphaera sp.]|nr:hypothetical protein [Pedosphaera sp.]